MSFKEWLLKEVGTSTNCIAGFSRIAIPLVRRTFVTDDLNKKKKQQPQVKETKAE